MRKLKNFVASIIVLALFFLPATLSFLYIFHCYPVMVNIMSSLGVEFVAILVVSVIMAIIGQCKNK